MANFSFGQDAESMGRDFGNQLAESIGVGIDEKSIDAITAMENVYVTLDNLTKNAAKNAEKYAKARQERELKNLKNSQKLGLISEKEYYEKLKEYRDKNLKEGSDEWYKYTEEIVFYNKRMCDEAIEQQKKMAEKIKALQDDLAEKLKTDDAPWFETTKAIFRGVGEHGGDLWFSKTELESFDEEILLLERYRDAITELKNLGNVPLGLFSDIAEMDVAEGLNAALAILGTDEGARNKFFSGYTARENLAESIARELNPILSGEELLEAGIASADLFNSGYFQKDTDGETEFIKMLKESFEYVPSSYFELGDSSAEAFGQGFMDRIGVVMEEIRAKMCEAINSIGTEVSAVVKGTVEAASGGDHRTYNNTYTFNASKDTTTQQLIAAKNAATLARLRGGE